MRWAIGGMLTGVACILAGIGVVFAVDSYIDNSPSGQRGSAACDRYVQTLLQSTDLVEITRASIIVREMPCNLRRRLPSAN